jgi:acetylornithine deacetylase/succinyl-diaminopimelate desuccinylase-like protein
MRDFLLNHIQAFAIRHKIPYMPEVRWKLALEPVCADVTKIEHIFQTTAQKVGFSPIDIGPSTGTSDLRHFVNAGIPCLLYGPGTGYNPHRSNECYYLDDLPKMILFYLMLIDGWCGNNDSNLTAKELY